MGYDAPIGLSESLLIRLGRRAPGAPLQLQAQEQLGVSGVGQQQTPRPLAVEERVEARLTTTHPPLRVALCEILEAREGAPAERGATLRPPKRGQR